MAKNFISVRLIVVKIEKLNFENIFFFILDSGTLLLLLLLFVLVERILLSFVLFFSIWFLSIYSERERKGKLPETFNFFFSSTWMILETFLLFFWLLDQIGLTLSSQEVSGGGWVVMWGRGGEGDLENIKCSNFFSLPESNRPYRVITIMIMIWQS